MFEDLFKKDNELVCKFIRHRNNSWEIKARITAETTCQSAGSIDSFVRGFNTRIAEYKIDSAQHIKTAYKAVMVDYETAHVLWVNHVKDDGKDVVIAVVKLRKLDK